MLALPVSVCRALGVAATAHDDAPRSASESPPVPSHAPSGAAVPTPGREEVPMLSTTDRHRTDTCVCADSDWSRYEMQVLLPEQLSIPPSPPAGCSSFLAEIALEARQSWVELWIAKAFDEFAQWKQLRVCEPDLSRAAQTPASARAEDASDLPVVVTAVTASVCSAVHAIAISRSLHRVQQPPTSGLKARKPSHARGPLRPAAAGSGARRLLHGHTAAPPPRGRGPDVPRHRPRRKNLRARDLWKRPRCARRPKSRGDQWPD
mmetsp:Transcript_27367/g.84828  ORF Transcript_27367/g.84828 Transcript_27367/m.84828 type:complete len:263 (-) Transcript_27367:724-1512(-)